MCVYDYSRSVGNETAYERYQRVQCHAGLIFKMAIFVQVLRSKVMALTSQYANKHGSPRPDLPVSKHGEGSRTNTKGEYVVPADVASPCVHRFRKAG